MPKVYTDHAVFLRKHGLRQNCHVFLSVY